MDTVIIFGGSGFIGSSFALFLVENNLAKKVVLCDIEHPDIKSSIYLKNAVLKNENIDFLYCDVRRKIELPFMRGEVSLIANFAAIHREPGHKRYEYFETNLLGAENVCNFAEDIGCNQIIFTSSIATYGLSDGVSDEMSIVVPSSPYGSSKLVAEKIHQIWQGKASCNRILQIVRPGVVFGPGEGGNVSRLIRALLHGYFFYIGNKGTRKAGVYVKELCHAMWWELARQNKCGENFSLFNMTMNPGPSVKDYVEAISKALNIKRSPLSVPYYLLLSLSYLIDFLAKALRIKHPFSPVRVKKLTLSNNVLPTNLIGRGYVYFYTLESALADGRNNCPDEWT